MVDAEEKSQGCGSEKDAKDNPRTTVNTNKDRRKSCRIGVKLSESGLQVCPATDGSNTGKNESKRNGEKHSIKTKFQDIGKIDAKDLEMCGTEGTIEGNAEGVLSDKVGGGKSEDEYSGDKENDKEWLDVVLDTTEVIIG